MAVWARIWLQWERGRNTVGVGPERTSWTREDLMDQRGPLGGSPEELHGLEEAAPSFSIPWICCSLSFTLLPLLPL